MSAIHHTPLATKRTKISQVRDRSQDLSSNKPVFETISSMKNAWFMLSASQKKIRSNLKSFTPIQRKEDIWASKVYEFDNTPNKPKMSQKKGGMTIKPVKNSLMNYEKYRMRNNINKNDSACSSKLTKISNNSSLKELSFEQINPNEVPKSETAPRKPEGSWTGGIFSKLRNFMSKELTKFPWKWSEQDKELNWWVRAAEWVRRAEEFRGHRPNMARYVDEYHSFINQLGKTYEADPNESIATIAREGFELQQNQIEKDIDRTLNDHKYFGNGKEGQEILRQILKILALKYTDIGYVQGMNFLVVSLLYHCSAEITLFLITILFEDYELWDVYRAEVQGLHQRNKEWKLMIEKCLPKIHLHFTQIGLDPQMFTTEWVLDLFSHTIPLNYFGKFLDNFISNRQKAGNSGWKYFNAVIIWILYELQKEILNKYEWDEVLVYIKDYVKEQNTSFFSRKLNWDKVFNLAVRLS